MTDGGNPDILNYDSQTMVNDNRWIKASTCSTKSLVVLQMFETELFKLMMLNKKRELENDSDMDDFSRFDIWDEIRKYKERLEK